MKADFESLPPEAQGMLLEMLYASGVESERFWKGTLLGTMPDSAVDSSDLIKRSPGPCSASGSSRKARILLTMISRRLIPATSAGRASLIREQVLCRKQHQVAACLGFRLGS